MGRSTGNEIAVDNRLQALRQGKGLSQVALAGLAGITRQAIYAIEKNQYLPSTAVALRLAEALECRVEDMFSLESGGDVVVGDLLGASPGARKGLPKPLLQARVKVARVGGRMVVRPVASLGDVLNFTVGADGLVIGKGRKADGKGAVQVRLLRNRRDIEEEVVVAGCDPSIFLVGEHVRRRKELAAVVGWMMGSTAALEALKRGEVHVAGVHVVDARSGECNLPYLRRHLKGQDVRVVTFASWTQGLMVRSGNPKRIRRIEDLARKDIRFVNREEGAGARILLDQQLGAAGLYPRQVNGYGTHVGSHLEVARLVSQGQVDAGIGVEAAARYAGLEFIPFQAERYDLVIPTSFLENHQGIMKFLDAMATRKFRTEIQALGGYDTRETGKEVEWRGVVA